MNEKTKICECCGQKIKKLNPHRMDKQKVGVLERMARLNRRANLEWVAVSEGLFGEEVINSPYCHEHAARLTWFGLVETKEKRSSLYRATDDGINFLLGKKCVPAVIWCREGTVIEASQEQIFIGGVRGVALDKTYWDNYPNLQKYPNVYNQMKLF